MTSQPRDKTRDSTKHDTAKFGIDLYYIPRISRTKIYYTDTWRVESNIRLLCHAVCMCDITHSFTAAYLFHESRPNFDHGQIPVTAKMKSSRSRRRPNLIPVGLC